MKVVVLPLEAVPTNSRRCILREVLLLTRGEVAFALTPTLSGALDIVVAPEFIFFLLLIMSVLDTRICTGTVHSQSTYVYVITVQSLDHPLALGTV